MLRSPIEKEFVMDEQEKKALAQYIQAQLPYRISQSKIVNALPPKALRAGKLRVLGQSTSICGLWAANRRSSDNRRDSSFVRVSSHYIYIPYKSTYNSSFNYLYQYVSMTTLLSTNLVLSTLNYIMSSMSSSRKTRKRVFEKSIKHY